TARAASGIAFPAPVVATIRVIPDAPPAIEIAAPAAPGEEVLASPTASIPIRAAARDDIALSRFTLTVTRPSTDASRELDLLESPTDSQRIAPGLARLDLASINAAPGEVLELAFFATDNRPADFGGAQRTTTAPIRIRIIEDAEMQSRSEEQQGASTSDPGAAMPADDPSDAASESPRLFPAEPTESDNEAPSESADQSSDSSSTDSTPSQAESAAPGAAAPSPESAPDAQRPRDAQADPASDAPSDHGVTILSSRTVDPAELQALLGADAPSYYESGSSAALDTGTIPTSAASISIVPATYRDLAARYLLELNRLEQRLAHPENDQ
ncbi:MAG: hypothetical protein VYC34_00635, partial [Planctomycetota bacterium]|nr:hypothetical protein [Planctomycetota bacterium]